MRYYFIAGEASGDLHAGNLIRELALIDQDAVFRGFGGEKMESSGMQLVKHYREMAFMGLLPVIMNIRTIKKNFHTCENDLLAFNPDVLILVDYPGFNLRMAAFAKKHGIKVYYYISPKVWAWKEHRVKKIKEYVDEMFTIFPFETEFFRKHGYQVNYVGNPLLDAVLKQKTTPDIQKFAQENGLEEKETVAIVPGSRKAEISHMLPVMLEASKAFPQYQYVVTGAPNMDAAYYEKYIKEYPVKVIWGKTYEIIQNSKAAMVTSGTVSLEVGLLNVPQVVCYKMAGGLPFHILGRIVIKATWASLVNIILNRTAVKELIQIYFTKRSLISELDKILHDEKYRQQMFESYRELSVKIGEPGASKRAAVMMMEKLTTSKSKI